MKALSGQISLSKLQGEIRYNGEIPDPKKFLVPKLVSYVAQTDLHAPALTVFETFEFAWKCTTGGHHAYGVAKDADCAEILNDADKDLNRVRRGLWGLNLLIYRIALRTSLKYVCAHLIHPFVCIRVVTVKVKNVLTLLGLNGCANTVVGEGSLRGVSGGEKRRVTVGEIMMTPTRVKCFDAITNGLDSSTSFDIIRSFKIFSQVTGFTAVISLLQVRDT